MAAALVVRPTVSLPADIDELLGPSLEEGHDLVRRLVDDWNDGSNRFDEPGEAVFEARIDGRLVAVGGLNRDPYLDDPDVGRIRHVYVMSDVRGMGVGSSLVAALVGHARGRFARVRLRTGSRGAPDFYLRIGFEETIDEEDATHQIRLP